MNEEDCETLTEYVRNLPTPVRSGPANDQEAAQIKSGEELFKTIGCAQCHLPRLGDVDGIYSDLLLHDMSPKLEDAAEYSVFVGDSPRANVAERRDREAEGPASVQEWRTPPLWGLRDSAPYLHDGRAVVVEQAILLHGGQGAASARKYADLSPTRKRNLGAFLMSLAAPRGKR